MLSQPWQIPGEYVKYLFYKEKIKSVLTDLAVRGAFLRSL